MMALKVTCTFTVPEMLFKLKKTIPCQITMVVLHNNLETKNRKRSAIGVLVWFDDRTVSMSPSYRKSK